MTTIPSATETAPVGRIPAVPTTYGGVNFRSRLEARWARLFDQIGVRWLYEPRTFKFSNGWYLPDFYVQGPVIGGGRGAWWVEIKPAAAIDEWGSLRIPGDQVHAQTGEPFLVIFGFPWERWTWTTWPSPAAYPVPWTAPQDTDCMGSILVEGDQELHLGPCGRCIECVAQQRTPWTVEQVHA